MRTEKEIREEVKNIMKQRMNVLSNFQAFKMRLLRPFKFLFEPLFQLAQYMGQLDMAGWILHEEDSWPHFTGITE
jgi:hypothetical protein